MGWSPRYGFYWLAALHTTVCNVGSTQESARTRFYTGARHDSHDQGANAMPQG